ncbi:MAG: Rne/Rng family ribonuclease [Actinobacteria bacterium]|nr:Rne/Rng family ribonuclease [Actinomycetota bacterium]
MSTRSSAGNADKSATEKLAKKSAKKVVKKVAKPEVDKPAKKAAVKKAALAPAFVAPAATKTDSTKKTAKAEVKPKTETVDTKSVNDDRRNRRRRRGGRGRGGSKPAVETKSESKPVKATSEKSASADESAVETDNRRRRRRRRSGSTSSVPKPETTSTVDSSVAVEDSSIRINAKRQRGRDHRDNRRRPNLITEAQFLARRESVDRQMIIRQVNDKTQVAILEDKILVEHYVGSSSSSSLIGNVYLGRVQNVLPGMEAAFIDIGKGRNAVLYAGEVNWDLAGLEGQPKRIELALSAGDPIMVQVTKDPIGQKGARLTSQVSLPGRYLVYVPDGSMTAISRKLPENERIRLKRVLRNIILDGAGVIVRTAAEGASEEELEKDVARLKAQWEDIKNKKNQATPPTLLYSEPDLAIRTVRDVFNEDFSKVVVSGANAWNTIEDYVKYLAPELLSRLEKWTGSEDVFTNFDIDAQLTKALDRKVYLPSGGSLVIDRTEAMTVVDVNTGRFIGSTGNLEETVTQNNLEAAEEIVRQLRLRDIGGIIVIDFIDMVLEANRDKVVRRLVECLGRDRTKHQVAEVSSLGLVQMTRKRIGQGLLEMFSEPCEICNGRGVKIRMDAPGVKHSHKPVRETHHPEPVKPIEPAPVEAEPVAPAFAPRGESTVEATSGRRNRKAASRPAGPPS